MKRRAGASELRGVVRSGQPKLILSGERPEKEKRKSVNVRLRLRETR